MAPRVAIIYYSMYGHIRTMALEVQKGIQEAGGSADLFQVPETLPGEILSLLHAPEKSTDPVATVETLEQYDAFIFGIPTRFGSFPAQWKSFWDATGALWAKGTLHGKYFSVFVATGTLGGGQETTVLNSLSTFVHHGMLFVPLGYKNTMALMSDVNTVRGGSAWGAGTLAAGDGSRLPSEVEREIARIQGKSFYETVAKAF